MLLPHKNEVDIRDFAIQAYSISLREYFSTDVHDKDICTVNRKYPPESVTSDKLRITSFQGHPHRWSRSIGGISRLLLNGVRNLNHIYCIKKSILLDYVITLSVDRIRVAQNGCNNHTRLQPSLKL